MVSMNTPYFVTLKIKTTMKNLFLILVIAIILPFSVFSQNGWNAGCKKGEVGDTCKLPKNEDCFLTFYCGDDSVVVDNRRALTYSQEDNDNLTNNRYNHSFGNGTEWTSQATVGDWGLRVPCDGVLERIEMSGRNTVGNPSTFQVTIGTGAGGAVPTGGVLTLPANTSSFEWIINQNFSSGDVLNLYTLIGNNLTDNVITWHFLVCCD